MRVGINGFGRIGRRVFRLLFDDPDVDVVAINDFSSNEDLAYLLKYDSSHGLFDRGIKVQSDGILVEGKKIVAMQSAFPSVIPWGDLDVDVVIESTGVFTSSRSDKGGYRDHLDAGAKKVILTVPSKTPDDLFTVVIGVNETAIPSGQNLFSNASCTTNCLAPVAKLLDDHFGIVQGFVTTVHAVTNDQSVVDRRHSDKRRGRASGQSIIPTTTGAARAVAKVLPRLEGKLDGMAMRVPVINGSVIDLVATLEKDTSIEALNAVFKDASLNEMKGILAYTEDPIVSVDIIGSRESSIVDGMATMAMGKMVKIVAWYDNESGYSSRIVDLIKIISS